MHARMVRMVGLAGLLPLVAIRASAAPAHSVIVVCAPGYPGSTEEAQSLLDDFTRTVARKAGWAEDALQAIYFKDEKAGLDRLAASDVGLAVVPLPFFLKHERSVGLTPRLLAVQITGGDEIWSLVARKGSVSGPADLKGWELTGQPGYAPAFVRGPILGDWGRPPDDTAITFTSSPLSALRRAASGEKIAVILDRAQAEALGDLPFGAGLQIVTRSKPMPGMILATVDTRLDEASVDELQKTLLRLHKEKPADEIMKSIRLSRFETIDTASIERARAAFEGG